MQVSIKHILNCEQLDSAAGFIFVTKA